MGMMSDEYSKIKNNVSMPMAKNVIRAAYKMFFSFKSNFTRKMHKNCIGKAESGAPIAK
jgi:hypothetical protein